MKKLKKLSRVIRILVSTFLIIFLIKNHNYFYKQYDQFKLSESYQVKIDKIIWKDRSFVRFITDNQEKYMIHLDDESYGIISRGDSILKYYNTDSIYLMHNNKTYSSLIIYYDPNSWIDYLLEDVFDDVIDIEEVYGKKPWKH